MSKSYKRWSKQEKLTVLREADQEGAVKTCRKYDVSSATFYHWKKIYDAYGEVGFSETKSPADKKYKDMEEENRRLKKLLVDKDLALEAQKEMLKKSLGHARPGQTIQEKSSRYVSKEIPGEQTAGNASCRYIAKYLLLPEEVWQKRLSAQ